MRIALSQPSSRLALRLLKIPLTTHWQRRILSSLHQMATPFDDSQMVPRLSASVIVVNAQGEVLLVQRNPKSTSFAGAHVFPGGNYDNAQDDSLQITAIRELFEETGLLLASPSPSSPRVPFPSDAELDAAREDVYAQRRLFRAFLSAHSLVPDTTALLPFTRWITPPRAGPRPSRRFDTQFFLALLPDSAAAGFSAGAQLARLPTPDGAREVIAARFVRPAAALAACRAHAIALMPPQVYLLTTLAALLDGADGGRARMRALACGAFGRMALNPRVLPGARADGRTVLTYEGDETRGGARGRLHRSLVRWGAQGVARDVEVQRNFDIFTEIEEHLFAAEKAKL